MKFEMKPLPYDYDALEPHISARTLEFHYDKHHKGYMSKLEKAIKDDPLADKSLEDIIRHAKGGTFNSAAQVWNHDFYWRSLSPDGGGQPGEYLGKALEQSFGDTASFRERLKKAAVGEFGSGWAWLVVTPSGKLDVVSTHDAANPLTGDDTPLLTIDVWEHAYYLDTQNDRGEYVDRVINELLNWQFAEENLRAFADSRSETRKAS